MIFYHFVYDLGEFGYVDYLTVINGYWKLFAQSIGSSFLFLSGFSFWIMVRGEINWIKYIKRLLILILSSLIISIGTYIQFKSAFVFFGILHLMVVCSIFGLIIYRLPILLLLVVAIFLLLLPEYFFLSSYYNVETFEPKYLSWTGLFDGKTGSVDFYAFMPWASAFVLGLTTAKILAKNPPTTSVSPLTFKEERTNFLTVLILWVGRNSLIVYLIHQPILFGLFISYGKFLG
jgi:uncharacterized membrane protein